MGFLDGRVTYERFTLGGKDLHQFDQRHVDILERHAIGAAGALSADGIEVGFTAGRHLLDLSFSLENNIINDALAFAVRIDTNKVPSDLFKAYMALELATLSADNPSGMPSKKQRAQAREAAEERCQEEAKDGRYRKRKVVPALWDARQEVVYLGSSSTNVIERFVSLFKEAFGRSLSRVTAGSIAYAKASERNQGRALEDLAPAAFAGPKRKYNVAWVSDQFGSRDFLGNEWLLWLWWALEEESESIKLADDSVATCMLQRTLSLECPLNETGKETIASESPTRLPEARLALLGGKLPRKLGMTVVRHDEQYELSIQAETLAVSGAVLPKLDGEPGRGRLEDRVDQLRHLTETLDLLFDVFCRRRLSSAWQEDLPRIRRWLEEKTE